MMMQKLMESWLAGETEVLRENLPQCRFVNHNLHVLPGREPGPPRWEVSDYPLELRHGLSLYTDCVIPNVSLASKVNIKHFTRTKVSKYNSENETTYKTYSYCYNAHLPHPYHSISRCVIYALQERNASNSFRNVEHRVWNTAQVNVATKFSVALV
jgi:hypothetical protein